MGFLDNVRSRFKNNEEEEFEQAFREGAWPEGVEDFEPLSTTGSFLPATYEIDPLADASLPGNAMRGQTAAAPAAAPAGDTFANIAPVPCQPSDEPPAAPAPSAPAAPVASEGGYAADSVVRAAATSVYAAPEAASPFAVIDGSLKPRPAAGASAGQQPPSLQQPAWPNQAQAQGQGRPQALPGQPPRPDQASWTGQPQDQQPPYAPQQQRAAQAPQAGPAPAPVQDGRPSGYSASTPRYDMGDDGVQVFARQGQRGPRQATPQERKPFADRLRERVAAANVAGQADETLGRSQAALQPVRPRHDENTSADELDAELEERRRSRRAASQARADRGRDGSTPGTRRPPAQGSVPAGGAAAPASGQRTGGTPASRDARQGAGSPGSVARPAAGAGRPTAPHEPVRPVAVPLSCTVVRARSYDDVRDVAQGVIGEHRPVVLVLRGTTDDLARRILDFSFGLCCASGAQMKELGNHVYAVVPRGTAVSDDDMASLRRQGLVR